MKPFREKTFNELKNELTENDIDQIIEIVGKRCRMKTITRLVSMLKYSASTIPSYGILERLTRDRWNFWSYCAGQSYPDEIRIIRNIIKQGK